MLPCLVGFVDGRETGRLVGFEGLVGGMDAGVKEVERVVKQWGIGVRVDREGERDESSEEEEEMQREGEKSSSWIGKGARTNRGGAVKKGQEDEDDDDWD